MNVLFVPSIGLDITLLDRLAASVDFHVAYKVAWNNGPLGALESFARLHRDWIVKDSGMGNLGVAGSWNECAKLFPDERTMLLMNEDAHFLPGQLEQICGQADHHESEPILYLNETQAMYCFVATKSGREMFGTFDENFWPAYYEDCDFRVRLRLAGVVHPYPLLPNQPPVPHGKPRSGGTNYSAMLQGCGLINRAYWLKKHGSFDFEKATYPTPYRDHRLKPSEWVWDPAHRAKLYPLWDTFINLPEPSIYG